MVVTIRQKRGSERWACESARRLSPAARWLHVSETEHSHLNKALDESLAPCFTSKTQKPPSAPSERLNRGARRGFSFAARVFILHGK
jgi:hypothetical protein